MDERTIIIHYKNQNCFVPVSDICNINVLELQQTAHEAFFGRRFVPGTDLPASVGCLSEGEFISEPLTIERLQEIYRIVQYQNSSSGNAENNKRPIGLWFYHYENNGLPFRHTVVESSLPSVNTQPVDEHNASHGTNLETTAVNVSSIDGTETPSDSAAARRTTMELVNEDKHRFTNDFRPEQKKQYRSDIFPKKPKVKNNEIPAEAQSTPAGINKKRKRTTKYAFHLQGVHTKKENGRTPYGEGWLPERYRRLIENDKTVLVCVAAVKYHSGCLYIDPLKGFVVDKKNHKIPLENPFILKLSNTNKNVSSNGCYPLKLALVQISGDIARQCTTEFKEGFKLNARTVNENPEDSDAEMMNEDDDSAGFLIAVVLAEEGKPDDIDWSTLIISNEIKYKIYPVKRQKTTDTTN
ncbi:unnamed protein product [Adineta ricciae]|uniref:Uncharacterized protein n=1 Tax=Adineta ricciae TaxID=249248 RepID=A0A816CX02_ADIRI|nr:unnamed protein product [Adineta ricciae]CAF1628803.1 unnamed protein product [Adineta ricciae]